MLNKTITFEDYNGNTVSEDFYFNLTKLEAIEHDLEVGGFEAVLEKLTETEDAKEAYALFKRIVLTTVGRKSEDGKRFIKSPEIVKEFEESPALAELIFEFLEHPETASEFIKNVLPSSMLKVIEENEKKQPQSPELAPVAPVLENTDISDEELLKMKPQDMTHEQLQRAFALKSAL